MKIVKLSILIDTKSVFEVKTKILHKEGVFQISLIYLFIYLKKAWVLCSISSAGDSAP